MTNQELTDQELIDLYDLLNHPMWNVEVGVWCQSIHHEVSFEKTTEPGRNRLLHVVRHKPKHEIPVRLAAMMPCEKQAALVLQPLYDKYEADLKLLCDRYETDCKPLRDRYEADLNLLHDKYKASRGPLYDKYQADLKLLYVGDWFDWDRQTLRFPEEKRDE